MLLQHSLWPHCESQKCSSTLQPLGLCLQPWQPNLCLHPSMTDTWSQHVCGQPPSCSETTKGEQVRKKKTNTHEQQLLNNTHPKSNEQHPSQENWTTLVPRLHCCSYKFTRFSGCIKQSSGCQTLNDRHPRQLFDGQRKWLGHQSHLTLVCDWHVLHDETLILPWFSGFQGVLLLGIVSFSQSAILILEIGLSKGLKMGDTLVKILKN